MNIYEIKNNFLTIFDELEENGGELTPELEQELAITREQFTEKVKDYTSVIKLLNQDIDAIKVEQKRLKDLSERKAKVVERLKNILVEAIEQFGDTKKSGVRYIDYGTGEVSIRKTEAVDVDENWVEQVGKVVSNMFAYYKYTNELDVMNKVNFKDLQQLASEPKEDMATGEIVGGIDISYDDAESVDVKLTVSVPLSDIISGFNYSTIKEIVKNNGNYKLETTVSKVALKHKLEENGSATPNLAKIKINKNVVIR